MKPRYCRRCGARQPFVTITSDHIVPRSFLKRLRIPSPPSNRQDLCQPCNVEKGDGPAVDYRGDRELYQDLVNYLEEHNLGIEVIYQEPRIRREGA